MYALNVFSIILGCIVISTMVIAIGYGIWSSIKNCRSRSKNKKDIQEMSLINT